METATTNNTCAKCKYWDNSAADNGECRRNSPQAVVFKVDAEVEYVSVFPKTKENDWCGDFQPR